MAVSYNGYNVNCLTMEKNKSTNIEPGDLAVLNTEGYLVNASNNDNFIGVVTAVRGNFVTVQTQGYAEIKYTGDITAGCSVVKSSGRNSVKQSAESSIHNKSRVILKVDSTNKKLGLLL